MSSDSSYSSSCYVSESSESSDSSESVYSSSSSISYCPLNDDFSGSSTSETPDPDKWRIVESYAAGHPYITGADRLRLRQASGEGAAKDVLESTFVFTGDFDVHVDYNYITSTGGVAWYCEMRAHDVGDDCNIAVVRYGFAPRGYGNEYQRHFYWRANCASSWSSSFEYLGGDHHPTGKLRLKRSGSTWSAYIWDATYWEQIGSDETGFSGDVTIRLIAQNGPAWPSGGYPGITWDADNFTIRQGCADTSTYSYSSTSSESSYSSESIAI